VKHFYHLWCGEGAAWLEPAAEHFAELRRVDLPVDLVVSLVGPEKRRDEVIDWLWKLHMPFSLLEAESGWEDITLRALQQWAHTSPPMEPVLYAHNKGSHNTNHMQAWWRREMTEYLVTHWIERKYSLFTADVACWAWMKAGSYESLNETMTCESDIPVGNFWMATAGYISHLPLLPVLDASNRNAAEDWIGTNNPVVAARLTEKWPVVEPRKWPPIEGEPSLEQKERELGLR
jgi:hypothetical protein